MISKEQANHFAQQWIAAWNSHDLNEILQHYSDDLEITTPMIRLAGGIDTGSLSGKQAVADYWQTAFKKVPDLHFELLDVTVCIDSVALYYKSIMNKKAVEVMFFNEEGKVNRMFAHYT